MGTIARHNAKNESKIGKLQPRFKETAHKRYVMSTTEHVTPQDPTQNVP